MSVALTRSLAPIALILTASAWASPPDYKALDADAEPLRAAFNADAGKVRVLMLVAPT